MNREPSKLQRRLLNDVLRENDGARQAALTAFRRARFVRNVGRLGTAAMLAAAVTVGILFSQRDSTPKVRTITATAPSTNAQYADSSTSQQEVPALTDEQLLASFPPNSCFLAEVDGRQVLVFTDPAVEKKVLHRPTVSQTHRTY